MTITEVFEVAGAVALAVGFAGHAVVLVGRKFGLPRVERVGEFLEGLGADWKKMGASVRRPKPKKPPTANDAGASP